MGYPSDQLGASSRLLVPPAIYPLMGWSEKQKSLGSVYALLSSKENIPVLSTNPEHSLILATMEIISYHSQTQHNPYSLFHTIYIMLRSHTIQYIPISHPTAFTLPLLQLRLTHILQCLRGIPAPSRATVSPGIYLLQQGLIHSPSPSEVHLFQHGLLHGPQCLQKCTYSDMALPMAAVPAGNCTCSVVVLPMATHFEVLQHDHMDSHRCFEVYLLWTHPWPQSLTMAHNHSTKEHQVLIYGLASKPHGKCCSLSINS